MLAKLCSIKKAQKPRRRAAEGPCTSAAISREVGSAVAPRLMGAFHSACRVRNILDDREGDSLPETPGSEWGFGRQTWREGESANGDDGAFLPPIPAAQAAAAASSGDTNSAISLSRATRLRTRAEIP